MLMGRFCFGEIGSKLADFILGFAELGWYAWGTATVAISLVKILALPEALTQPLMVLFGILFRGDPAQRRGIEGQQGVADDGYPQQIDDGKGDAEFTAGEHRAGEKRHDVRRR